MSDHCDVCDPHKCVHFEELKSKLREAKASLKIEEYENDKLLAERNRLQAELSECKEALSGRTVSCSKCNQMAKDLERGKK